MIVMTKVRNLHREFVRAFGGGDFTPNVLVINPSEYRTLCDEMEALNPYQSNTARRNEFMGMRIYQSSDAPEPRVMIDPLA